MKLLIIAPQYNGLMKYSQPVYEYFKREYGDNAVKYLGFANIDFDLKNIEKKMDMLIQEIEKFNPDVIHYNYGTYDCEQLVPYFMERLGYSGKSFLTYHSLQFDLFKKLKSPLYDEIANEYIKRMDGYCFFTDYARGIFETKNNLIVNNYVTSFHPATHNNDLTSEEVVQYNQKYNINPDKKYVTLLGYASHWKETKTIIKLAQKYKDIEFIVAGPYWQEKILKENEGVDLSIIPNLHIINRELLGRDFNFFLTLGVGLFPYNYFQSFQGSGLLPNYLHLGIPCLVNNIAPLQEYCGDYEFCFDFSNEEDLFRKFEKIISQDKQMQMPGFSYEDHCKKIKTLYKK